MDTLSELDAETAYYLLLAFPQLDAEFQTKKRLWLFGKVLPILCEWLPGDIEGAEVLSARAVCRSWRTAVHLYLDSQPGLQPYLPHAHDENFAIRRRLLVGWQVFEHFFTNVRDAGLVERDYGWLINRQGDGRLLSPELYRSVDVGLEVDDVVDWEEIAGFYNRLSTFLCHVGEFVHSLSVTVSSNEFLHASQHSLQRSNETWKGLFALLPNLRQLIVVGFFPCKNEYLKYVIIVATQIYNLYSDSSIFSLIQVGPEAVAPSNPFPTQIQSLQLRSFENGQSKREMLTALFDRTEALQLCSVELSLDNLDFEGQMAAFHFQGPFENMTQLDLVDVGPHHSVYVKTLLQVGLDAPNLSALVLQFSRGPRVWDSSTMFSVEADIIPLLLRFQMLRSLELGSDKGLCLPVCGGDVEQPPIDDRSRKPAAFILSYLSIKHNTNRNSGNDLSYQFLKIFKNLRYLHIIMEQQGRNGEDDEGEEEEQEANKNGSATEKVGHRGTQDNPVSWEFRASSLYNHWIWESAPKLSRIFVEKEVTTGEETELAILTLDRWTYERLQAKT